MLKRAFALSDQGAKDLAKGIIATACANLIQIIPASLLLMVVMMLLEKAAGTQVNVGRNIPFFVGITLVLFGMIAIAQLVQYNLTYTAAYKESANRRIVLAEKLRKLPLSFFEKKNLADLTTTIMGDCTALLAEVFAALVSIGRMKQIDNTQEQTGSDCCNNIGCDIEFKDVYFSYNEEPVLTGVSFVAKQGEITALVGPSGSGKSTVSKLAARFWDADSGLITLGGIDVKTVEPEVLLKNYAIVFQNVTLFDESVMENIRLGRSGASDEDVRAAAKAAQCDEFIDRLPQGYDTNIGENGSKLSGGERQRISIARALLKNAPVILLDEATASMDAESETMVQTALSALLKGRTVIVIAHRMRTIANADKIVVLDKGKVTEVGTPSELAKKGGLYAHLVALQQKQQMSSLPT